MSKSKTLKNVWDSMTTLMKPDSHVKSDSLDLSVIYLSWACPACGHVNQQFLHEIAFSIDLDVTITKEGYVAPYIMTVCPFCTASFERRLNAPEPTGPSR